MPQVLRIDAPAIFGVGPVSWRDIGASVRQRPPYKSPAEERPFQELLQYLAMERFLYRLLQSTFSNPFALKCGGLYLWTVSNVPD